MFNKRNETVYFYTENDTQLQPLVGKSSYEVTFPKGRLPPSKGFWSLSMYNPDHFFYPNAPPLPKRALMNCNDATLCSSGRT